LSPEIADCAEERNKPGLQPKFPGLDSWDEHVSDQDSTNQQTDSRQWGSGTEPLPKRCPGEKACPRIDKSSNRKDEQEIQKKSIRSIHGVYGR